jgi:FkbM family methyltransferase
MSSLFRAAIDWTHRRVRRGRRTVAVAHLAAARAAIALRWPRRAESNPPPLDVLADRVRIHSVSWWIPRDARTTGTLSDRVFRGELPIGDVLQTRPFIRRGAMIDIGANIGTTSITRLLLGHVDYVYAIEPDPANYACLVRSAFDNGLDHRLSADNIALADHDGDATLMRADAIGRHRLRQGDGRLRGPAVKVRTMTLDNWARWRGCDRSSVTYIKCDTQGWEDHILRGAPEWLSYTHIAWELELCPRLLEKAGSSLAGVCRRLQDQFAWFVELRAERWNPRRQPTTVLLPTVERALAKPRNYTNVIVGH